MNINWEQIIGQLGVAGILAIFFYLLMKAYIQRTSELLEDKRLAEKTLIEKTDNCAKLTAEFTHQSQAFSQTAEAFTTTMSNHLVHSELAFKQQMDTLRELTHAVNTMCARLEPPDYQIKAGGSD